MIIGAHPLAVIVLAAACLFAVPAAAAAPDLSNDLSAISSRGRALFEYDAEAADASDAVLAKAGSDTSNLGSFIGRKSGESWTFDFGKLDADGSSYRVAYRAVRAARGAAFEVTKYDTPIAGDDFEAASSRGIALAAADFGPVNRAYNYAVLPAEDGKLIIYYYPAQTNTRVHPLGGDERYLAANDGRTLLAKHRMHRAILEQPSAVQPGQSLAAGVHTDIFGDVPEDTDVFHVLIRVPHVPEFVVIRGRMFYIEINGSIQDRGMVPR